MNFYRISTDEGKRKKFAYGILLGEYQGKIIHCKNCGREWKTEPLLNRDTYLKVSLTNECYPDFVHLLYNRLISEHVKDIFINENIKGYCLGKVNLIPKDDIPSIDIKKLREDGLEINKISNSPPVYYRLDVDMSAELHKKSNVVLKEKCEYCGYEKYEKIGDVFAPNYIKKESWNGDDLFMVKEFCAAIYCTENFLKIYKKHKLEGLIFKRIEGI